MKFLTGVLILGLLMMCSACQGEDLKKQLEQKNQIVNAQSEEIKRLKDDMAAREADLKSQCEQRLQKATVQSKQQIDTLNAKIADLNKRREAEKSQKPEVKHPSRKSKS
jgi:septal ring factor EnvC (AmiA/AmiB activator)